MLLLTLVFIFAMTETSVCAQKEEVYKKIGILFEEAVKLAQSLQESDCQIGDETNPANSCAEITTQRSDVTTGYYWVKAVNGTAIKVFCDGEWMRVGFLNMTDPDQDCPPTWKEIPEPVRTCTKQHRTYHCDSVFYSTHGLQYTAVRGRVVAYQHGRTYGFTHYNQNKGTVTIDTHYLDGVSITYGTPRKHIWSFAASLCELYCSNFCPCTSGNSPPWVGEDYFCESGSPNVPSPPFPDDLFFEEDVLWDGEGCGAAESCCKHNNPPWFTKSLKEETDADIEVRSCGTINSTQDVPVEVIEIFIK